MNKYNMLDWSYYHGCSKLHRGGWHAIIQYLKDDNYITNPEGVGLTDLMESYFVWKNNNPLKKQWVGISHFTHNPAPIDSDVHIDITLNKLNFLYSLEACEGIVVLSDYMKDYFESKIGDRVKIYSIKYPVPKNVLPFDLDLFHHNGNKKIISLGKNMRRVTSIYRLKTDLPKIWLSGQPSKNSVLPKVAKEASMLGIRDLDLNSVELYYSHSHSEFDDLLRKNIILVDLFDASANNSVVECIAGNTPFFCRRLPAVEEYIGKDYPMFFDDLEFVEDSISDLDRLSDLYTQTFKYLLDLDKSPLSYQAFCDKLMFI
jgi:hypothetical protein